MSSRKLLKALVITAGIYSASNAEVVIKDLSDLEVLKMIELLKSEKINPAIRVAVSTDMGGGRRNDRAEGLKQGEIS